LMGELEMWKREQKLLLWRIVRAALWVCRIR